MKNLHLLVYLAKLMGLMHMEVDKVAAMVVNMEDDMVSDKAAAKISRKC